MDIIPTSIYDVFILCETCHRNVETMNKPKPKEKRSLTSILTIIDNSLKVASIFKNAMIIIIPIILL